MITIIINAFSFIRRDFAGFFVMLFEADLTSLFISTDADYEIVSLTIKTLFDSTIVDKKFARNMRVLVQ